MRELTGGSALAKVALFYTVRAVGEKKAAENISILWSQLQRSRPRKRERERGGEKRDR